jgi:hypothetical protein
MSDRKEVRLVSVPDHVYLRCLAQVRVRPGMYLGDERVKTLAMFLCGYERALCDLGGSGMGAIVLTEFREWLSKELNESRSLGWSELIELEDASARNIYTFFRRFEQFLETRGENLDTWTPSWAK